MRLVVAMVLVAAAAVHAQSTNVYDVVDTVVLPKGEARAGVRHSRTSNAMSVIECRVTRHCHPIAELKGPDLNALLQLQAKSDLAATIIAPSHSLSVRTSEAVKAQMWKQGASPMGDFSRVITVRQLADLLAYLRTIR